MLDLLYFISLDMHTVWWDSKSYLKFGTRPGQTWRPPCKLTTSVPSISTACSQFSNWITRPVFPRCIRKILKLNQRKKLRSIHLLKIFMDAEEVDNDKIMWYILLHLTFVASAFAMGYLDILVRDKPKSPATGSNSWLALAKCAPPRDTASRYRLWLRSSAG